MRRCDHCTLSSNYQSIGAINTCGLNGIRLKCNNLITGATRFRFDCAWGLKVRGYWLYSSRTPRSKCTNAAEAELKRQLRYWMGSQVNAVVRHNMMRDMAKGYESIDYHGHHLAQAHAKGPRPKYRVFHCSVRWVFF